MFRPRGPPSPTSTCCGRRRAGISGSRGSVQLGEDSNQMSSGGPLAWGTAREKTRVGEPGRAPRNAVERASWQTDQSTTEYQLELPEPMHQAHLAPSPVTIRGVFTTTLERIEICKTAVF